MDDRVELFVIGGGIHGAAIARDAVGRGVSVMLAEMADFGSASSAASGNIVGGAVSELLHWRLGRASTVLAERAVLMRLAPHLVRPQRFNVPLRADVPTPGVMLRTAIALSDLLAGRAGGLPAGDSLSWVAAMKLPYLKDAGLRGVLSYSDCVTDDARLVAATVLDARDRGAKVRNYTRVTELTPTGEGFRVRMTGADGAEQDVHANFVVNAAGPWVNGMLKDIPGHQPARHLALVRGSHLVLPVHDGRLKQAFTLPQPDGRLVHVLPWQMGRFALLGASQTPHTEEGRPRMSEEERDYLLAAWNRHCAPEIKAGDPVRASAGLWVVPLGRSGRGGGALPPAVETTLTGEGRGGLLTLYGGSLTTHRLTAETVLARLRRAGLKGGPRWTHEEPLTGGGTGPGELAAMVQHKESVVAKRVRLRWALTYGGRMLQLESLARSSSDLAHEVAVGVPAAELKYAVDEEEVVKADDFLERRTRLGLELSGEERRRVAAWIDDYRARLARSQDAMAARRAAQDGDSSGTAEHDS